MQDISFLLTGMGLGVKIISNQLNDGTEEIVLQEVSSAFRHYTPWTIEDGLFFGQGGLKSTFKSLNSKKSFLFCSHFVELSTAGVYTGRRVFEY